MPRIQTVTGMLVLSMLITGLSSMHAGESAFVMFADPELEQGREIWMENCHGCHAFGTAGAPVPMEPRAWENRLTKGKAVLYEHALNGFFGPDDTMMPARGGNPKLSDEEVRAAVDYMTALAEHYLQSK